MSYWKPELLDQLLKVQDVDLEIRALNNSIQDYYRRLKEEDPTLSRLKRRLAELEDTISSTESQKEMYSSTLDDICTAIKGLVTTKSGAPKLRTRSSTEALRVEEEKLTTIVAETEEQLNFLNNERKIVMGRIQGRSGEMEAMMQGPAEEIQKLDNKIQRLERQRTKLVAGLPSMLLRKYDRLRNSSSGISLTVVKDHVCTVCRMQMPTAIISLLNLGGSLPACPACGRMVARVETTPELAPKITATKEKEKKERKKPAAKKAVTKKAAAKKQTPKKAAAKKAVTKKAAVKKQTPKKAATKKAVSKKAAAKKQTPKKAATKKAVSKKKAAVKKQTPKKAAAKKAVTKKKAAAKKQVPKKAAAKKAVTKKKAAAKKQAPKKKKAKTR
jgi:predicted  nucleic acid-binding Zn-ribbon protein